jgi:hypothetical protein
MVIALLLAAALAVVALRVQIVREGYEIQRLEARRAVELDQRRDLDAKMAGTVTATNAQEMNSELGLGFQPPRTLPRGTGEQVSRGTPRDGGRQ